MDLERAIEFLLEQQAASQARLDAQMAASQERHDREIGEIRQIIAATQEIGRQTREELRRAVRLSVQEARAERKRRKEEDAKLAAADEKLAASQEDLRQTLKAFIDSMKQPRNGHDKN
jgi:hypothetical protein